MRTEFLCIFVLRVASGPRVKLASCKSALNPPVVYSTDRPKAVVLMFLLFVGLSGFFFSVCVVLLALWSPSLITAHFAFCFTSCVVMPTFWSPFLLSVLLDVIKNGIGTQGEVG